MASTLNLLNRTLNSYDLFKIKQLYKAIDNILITENTKTNKSKLVSFNAKGVANGIIKGRVRIETSGNLLTNAIARLYDENGNYIDSASIDQVGRYIFTSIVAGIYTVVIEFAGSNSSLQTTAFPNIPCSEGPGFGCDLPSLQFFPVAENDVIENIDISIASKPTVVGKVYNSEIPSDKVGQASIRVFDTNQNLITTAHSSNDGGFSISLPQAGDYYFIANHSSYVEQIFDNVACLNSCDFSLATLVHFNYNESREGFDFALTPNAHISGSIIDAMTLEVIENADIHIYNNNEQRVSSVTSQFDGSWVTDPLPVGEYKILSRVNDYVTTMYDSIACANSNSYSCDVNLGLSISLGNLDEDNIHLKQVTGAKITGRVVDSLNQPVLQAHVRLFDSDGNQIFAHVTTTDANGYYETHHIGNGSYYLVAYKGDFYQYQLYPSNLCSELLCDITQGTALTVTNLSDISDIDFHLLSTTKISGNVVDSENLPINGIRVTLKEYHSNIHKSVLTDANGNYSFFNMQPGSYHLYSQTNFLNYNSQSYNAVPCINSNFCDSQDNYTPVVVNATDIENINFQLTRDVDDLSTISGNIVDVNNNPIAGVRVGIRKNNSSSFVYTNTNSIGNYSFTHQTAGTYQLSATKKGYITETYDNVACLSTSCLGDNFTPVIVNVLDVNNIDFQLDRRQQLTVNLHSNSLNEIDGGGFFIFDEQNAFIAHYFIDKEIDLPVGNYYFYYSNNPKGSFVSGGSSNIGAFISKVYGASNCYNNCDASIGTMITISANTETIVDMNLDEAFYINLTSNQLTPITYEVYNDNNLLDFSGALQPSSGFYIRDQEIKKLKISRPGYFSKLFDGIECLNLSCDISSGTPITPVLNSSMTINTDLTPIATLSGTVTDQDGNPLENVNIILESDFSFQNFSSFITDANGNYTIDYTENGNYYIKATLPNTNVFAHTYFGNISCEAGGCETSSIPIVAINPSDNLTDYNIVMNKRGTISGDGILDINGDAISSSVRIYKINTGQPPDFYAKAVSFDGTLLPTYLKEGQYKIIVFGNAHQVYSLYPNTICGEDLFDCIPIPDETSATFQVVNGENTHFSDFTVHKRGRISGQVVSHSTGQLISTVNLKFYKNNDINDFISVDSENGIFDTALTNGQYKVFVSDNQHINQLYDDIDCADGIGSSCFIAEGTNIAVDYDENISLNLSLKKNPNINIIVKNFATGEVLASDVIIYNTANQIVYSDFGGINHKANNLETGSYYVLAGKGSDYQITGYPNIACSDLNQVSSCTSPLTPIDISYLNNSRNLSIFITLNQGINGYVTDINTGLPLDNIIIDYWNESGFIIGSTVTSFNGGFSLPVVFGDYYLSTDTNNAYTNEIYKDINCANAAILGSCNVMQGEIINLPQNNLLPIFVDIKLYNTADQIFTDSYE